MKVWTLTAAALAATLSLAGCAEDGLGSMIEADAPEPGDPAVYAPDGWPLQIGELVSTKRKSQVWKGFPSYQGITGMHVVNDRIYGARFTETAGMPPTFRYEGHFPAKARWQPERDRAEDERRWLPERFRGKIEYEPPPQYVGFDEHGEPYLIRELLSPMHAQREERRKQRDEERRKR